LGQAGNEIFLQSPIAEAMVYSPTCQLPGLVVLPRGDHRADKIAEPWRGRRAHVDAFNQGRKVHFDCQNQHFSKWFGVSHGGSRVLVQTKANGYGFDPVTLIEVQALISFIREKVQYQSRVGRIIRTVSEAGHFDGQYRNSTEAKSHNLVMSRGAAELITRCANRRDFERLTVLEHPLTIKQMYNDHLLPLASSATFSSVVSIFRYFPLITVTRKENRRLTHRDKMSPHERYKNARIEVGHVDKIVWGRSCTFKRELLADIPNPDSGR
jgi:hypothetical protein